ncbi:uncharacterized protein LALA0_S01e07976g [Lachancea lanzarotensis]|uniref:LALA0S01e07976g1_1 n=1 Tax=Lachancea lanzarotensis TaxID=1245769 RepID=A0A0C7MSP7_9SACH|nr:uncharacterized protein LALA0_S01e07976g [Lachancea lanzarotensis]CEP60319.1 LALA0S01e07976g1_1 [Lachancea lanzarotensis]
MKLNMGPHLALSPRNAIDKTWRYMNGAFNVVKSSGKLVQMIPHHNTGLSTVCKGLRNGEEGSFCAKQTSRSNSDSGSTRRDTVVQRHVARSPISSETTLYTTETTSSSSQSSSHQQDTTSHSRRRRRHRRVAQRVHFEDEVPQDPFIITIPLN